MGHKWSQTVAMSAAGACDAAHSIVRRGAMPNLCWTGEFCMLAQHPTLTSTFPWRAALVLPCCWTASTRGWVVAGCSAPCRGREGHVSTPS